MLQKGEILNQEERAEKWFKHIERAECIPLETKKDSAIVAPDSCLFCISY